MGKKPISRFLGANWKFNHLFWWTIRSASDHAEKGLSISRPATVNIATHLHNLRGQHRALNASRVYGCEIDLLELGRRKSLLDLFKSGIYLLLCAWNSGQRHNTWRTVTKLRYERTNTPVNTKWL